jgi:hypothetical protein
MTRGRSFAQIRESEESDIGRVAGVNSTAVARARNSGSAVTRSAHDKA